MVISSVSPSAKYWSPGAPRFLNGSTATTRGPSAAEAARRYQADEAGRGQQRADQPDHECPARTHAAARPATAPQGSGAA